MLKDVTHRSQDVTCHSDGHVESRYCPKDRRKGAEGEADRQTDLVSLPFHSALVQISSEKTTLILVFLWSDFYVVKLHTGKCQ